MSWNYRVIEFVDPDGTPWRAIHEVYYDEGGRPTSYTEKSAGVMSAGIGKGPMTNDGLREVLNLMLKGLDKPVLVERDFIENEQPTD